MIKRIAKVMAVAFMFTTLTGVAFAGHHGRDHDGDPDQDRDCWESEYSTDINGSFILAKARQRTPDKDKDKDKECKGRV